MAARSASSAIGYDQQASQLREQLQRLLPDQIGTAASAVADDANARMRQLLDYTLLAVEFRKPLGDLARRLTGRTPQPAANPTPKIQVRRRGIGGRLRRHPFLAVGLAVGAGLVAYRLAQMAPQLLQRAK